MKYKAEPKNIWLCAGGVDEESMRDGKALEEVKAKANHIFVGEKAGWYTLGADGLDMYEKLSDSPKIGGHGVKCDENA